MVIVFGYYFGCNGVVLLELQFYLCIILLVFKVIIYKWNFGGMNLNFIMIYIVKQFFEYVKLDFIFIRYIILNLFQLLKLFRYSYFIYFVCGVFFWLFWIGLGVNICRNEKEILLFLQYKGFNRFVYIVYILKYLQNYYFIGKFRLIC